MNQRDGNANALKRAYGSRLGGPYLAGTATSPDVFYEPLGTLRGRPVHTVFDVAVDEPSRPMVWSTTVAYCTGVPGLNRLGCGAHQPAAGWP